MTIFCFIEKFVKKPKLQLLIVTSVWLVNILSWGYDHELKLGMVFSQYFLVFMTGVWINKFNVYEKATSGKTALVAIPFVFLFSVDISSVFTGSNVIETVGYLFYFNGRSIVLSLGTVLVVLFVFRKLRVSCNRFVESIAKTSIIIYFMEPFLSFVIRNYVFGQPAIYFADCTTFCVYQLVRAGVLFAALPLVVSLINRWVVMKGVREQKQCI
jgi:hypothetical protein